MPLDNNKPVSKTKGSRRRNQANEEVSSPPMLRFDSDVDIMPPHLRYELKQIDVYPAFFIFSICVSRVHSV